MTRKMRANKDLVGEWVPIGDLTPWDKNPRDNDHAVQSVADSIQRFGWGEISPTYCDVIRRRWTRYAAKHNLDAGSGALED